MPLKAKSCLVNNRLTNHFRFKHHSELRSHLMTSSQDSPTVEDDGDEQMEGLTIGAQQEVKNPAPQGPPARVSKLLELRKRLHELHNRQTQTDNNKL